jgi:hypothetical protein
MRWGPCCISVVQPKDRAGLTATHHKKEKKTLLQRASNFDKFFGTTVGSCENGNEVRVPEKAKIFLTSWLRDYNLLNEGCTPCS